MKIQQSTRNAIVRAIVACEETDSAFDALRSDVRKHKLDRETFEGLAREGCAVRYDVELITKSTGRVVFDSSAPKYETARKRLQRLMAEVFPTSKREDREIPAHILKLAEALARACAKHDEKGKKGLGSAALAKAW
jgi:hypothetical protein